MPDPRTYFASAQRSSPEDIARRHLLIVRDPLFGKLLDLFPEMVMIIDRNRQTVYANRAVEDFVKKPMADILGLRPGEAFGCMRAHDEEGGCGTSLFCGKCGAVQAIVASQKDHKEQTQECRITTGPQGAQGFLDLRVWAVPVRLEQEDLTVFIIKNIADEKRREVLERTFFHDVLNETMVLSGYLENLRDRLMPLNEEAVGTLHAVTKRVISNITEHQQLVAAERGTLVLMKEPVLIVPFLREIADGYKKSRFGDERTIVVREGGQNDTVTTDRDLLGRVIGNLVKNALEATGPGGTVTIAYERSGAGVRFSVHNDAVMPAAVQLQVFQRSFSTKGPGRGIGTYSVKFLTETYLKGTASFVSAEGAGTTFFVTLSGS